MSLPYPTDRSPDTTAEIGQPVIGLAPAGVGVFSSGTSVVAGRGVGAEKLHPALLGVQVAKDIGEELVGHVAVGVDHEAIVAQAAGLRGPALQPGQVDP